jgi:DNA topoisomerase I
LSATDPDRLAAADARAVRRAHLRFVRDSEPGLRRRRIGRNFIYTDAEGKRIRDPEVLQRIRQLAIPPAYNDVWICADELGYLQATGRDARGRKQYRYHPDWRTRCENQKFARVAAFGRKLPALRRRVRRDLAMPGLAREKILALVTSVMSETLIRVGNREYTRQNRSYGLTTLRSRHVQFPPGRACFRFRGKSGQPCDASIDDPRLVRLIRRCQQLPGQLLFQYLDEDGAPHPVDSGAVNDYLRDTMGEAFTAKDFRTWGGTVAAAEAFAATPLPDPASERALASCQAAAVRQVADVLGNTVAVCRASYIHPRVFEAWRTGELHRLAAAQPLRTAGQRERFVLSLLEPASSRDGRG